uniref:Reverse transcriptase domain-containing protein n=1 Tax=Trichogramma kaykai TaxID=54128 RepID=A0ABD2X0E8_9HYME
MSLFTLQISAYLEENSLLSPLQSEFRSGYSTQTALLKVTKDIRQAIDKSLVTVLVLFDFKCAFDTLNHTVLLRRLRELGFEGLSLRLVHSFLSERRQAVIGEGGETSSYRACTSGVPQGSSAGPILFSIFINSLLDVLQHCGTTAMLFANDLQIYLSCEPDKLNDAIAMINADAHSVLQWSRECGLTLNIPKTQVIVVASDQRHMRLDLHACDPVRIDGVTVPFQEKVRDLGMIITRNMSWKAHVNQLSSRVHGVLHRLRAHSRLLSNDVR